ncbi:T9SS type A sorting domain-containing protein [Dyadobacter sp. CY326]|uniref:T9SS type A sorting domain-containing protein n=1 Tax=Dyadobacter sp. CY326 TaxID=2907300 RepID=UPI001F358462|nr:T9SS type A sorting domain-containing protein [Dyadobacter sp. CY326]MCE7065646.1 T9SS type A sorting domain-containing protein [Dyadobacter sp. CY326]
MKNFTLLFGFLLLTFLLPRNVYATDDCGCKDSENALKNGNFESTEYWKKSDGTNFRTDDAYNICGQKNGLIDQAGFVYQDVQIAGGSAINMTVYGGTHDRSKTHKFYLLFYNSNNEEIESERVTVDMNYQVTGNGNLQKYTLSKNAAPSNAVRVRFAFYSSGAYFKVDVACMSVTPPAPADCGCPEADNAIKNGSFENGTNNWIATSGTNFRQDDPYSVCGSKNGLIDGAGTVYQEVNLSSGSRVNLTVYGGTHDTSKNHQFKLEFYTSSGALIQVPTTPENTVDMNFQVSEQHKLQQYTLSGTAPFGAAKVRLSIISSGNYFKVDVVCMSITPATPPTCETCNNNKLVNESFENGTEHWATTGTVITDATIAVCGTKSLILAGPGSFSQDIPFVSTLGNAVNLSIWAAVKQDADQKIEVIFLDANNKVLGTLTQNIDKLVESNPWGFQRYNLAGAIPNGTTIIRIIGSATTDYLAVDSGCLTFSGPPLPVTLAAFNVKKEGNVATLVWSTTSESNSDHFEVQHSGDGKKWDVLAIVTAQGESKALVTYNYTHTSPLATNLYRLKMIDQDETFAFSSIKSLNFDGDAQISVYPNPTTDHLVLNSNAAISSVKFYDQRGVLVMNALPDASNAIDVKKLNQGIYFIKINNSASTKRIVIVR